MHIIDRYAPPRGSEPTYPTEAHDSTAILGAVGGQTPLGGFFCNGEVGPLGIKGVRDPRDEGTSRTFLHGFTSVIALMYDTTPRPAPGAAEPGDATSG